MGLNSTQYDIMPKNFHEKKPESYRSMPISNSTGLKAIKQFNQFIYTILLPTRYPDFQTDFVASAKGANMVRKVREKVP